MPIQINSLLLSLAAPAAAKTIDAAAGVIGQLGQGFVRTLAGSPSTSQPSDRNAASSLEQFADDLRDYLNDKGIAGRFKLRYQMNSMGEASSAVSGPDAERVAEHISQHPDWMRALRNIAAELQSARSSPSTGRAALLTVEISDLGSSHWSAL